MDKPFSLDELIDIFWKSDAAEVLASQWSIATVHVRRNMSLVSLTRDPIPDYLNIKPPEIIEYYLEGQRFGNEWWVTVMCNQQVIVPPFPFHRRSEIPKMYPKESRLAARSGTPRLDF